MNIEEIPESYPSLCIPRVTTDINEKTIKTIIDKLELGIINKIQIVRKTKNPKDKTSIIYIHFKKWNTYGNGLVARERLLNKKDIKIIYDSPWYWKIYAYRSREK